MTEKLYKEIEDIVNKSPAVAFLWRNSENWPVEYVTDNIKQFGYEPSVFLSGEIKYAEIIYEDDLERVAAEVAKFSESGVVEFTQEYRIVTKEGNTRWIDDRTWIRRNKKGEITHYQGIVMDISDRKFLEEELLKSEENYRLISENANDLISVFDEKFRFEYVNENIHHSLMGYNKEDLIGKSGLTLIHHDDQKIVAEALRDLNNTGIGLAVARIKHKNGQYIWTETKGKSFYDRKGEKKFLLITRDISEREKSRQKLIESEEKYRIAYENENFYKDLFTHDIKNILQGILSSLELYKLEMKSLGIELKNQNVFNEIENQITRGSNLVRNVRKFSEFDKLNVELNTVDLIETVKNSFENIKNSVKEKVINVSYDFFSDISFINANELLNDVIENILLNAIIHNANKNVDLLIRTTRINQNDEKFIKIEFIDNGIGISNIRKNLIFKRGFNEEKDTTGMGLGLSLVSTILGAYEAKIWVEDKIPGDYSKGSSFIILFPEVKV